MLHPHTELKPIDEVIGYGVTATRPIPMGTITWVRDPLDQAVDSAQFEAFGPDAAETLSRYTYLDHNGDRILCWDLARFMNHNCEANTLSPGLPFDIAIRDIEAGEEITTDYGALNLEEPFPCACGSSRCRRTIRPADFEAMAASWDVLVRAAFTRVGVVGQPLWRLLRDTSAIDAALADPARVPSILRNRWPGALHAAQDVASRRPNR